MGTKIAKIQNPQYGNVTVSYRNSKGQYSGALSKTTNFQYILKNGSLSRKIPFPKELKRVQEKEDFIYLVLAKIEESNKKRKTTIASKKGIKVQLPSTEEVLNIPPDQLERLRSKFPETFRASTEERIGRLTDEDYSNRMAAAIKVFRDDRGWIFNRPFTANTFGRQNSYDKNGNPSENWLDNQVKINLVRKVSKTRKSKRHKQEFSYVDRGSIMYQINRYVRDTLTTNKNLFLTLSRKAKARKVRLTVGIVTDVSIHPDYLLGNEPHVIDFNSKGEQFKREVDRATWHMSKEVLRLINTDYEGDDEISGRLTSGELYTKIRLDKKIADHVSYEFFMRVQFQDEIR